VHIRRVRVEEGFLDGLDLRLVPGLNVVIGARGTGKTSLIELIRFCLHVKGYTGESNQRSVDHARSILDSGEVTLDVEENELITLIRQAEDEEDRQTAVTPPIIFSQMEIESIGLEPSGRLRLIDGFIDERRKLDRTEGAAATDVRSLTSEAHVVIEEIDELAEQLSALPSLEQQIKELLPAEQRLSEISADAARKKLKLDELTQALANRAVAARFVERYRTAFERWKDAIEGARQAAPQSEPWTGSHMADPLTSVRHHQQKAAAHLKAAADELAQLDTKLSSIARRTVEQRQLLDEQSRELRGQVEGLQEGAGAIVRQGQQFRERMAQLESLRALVEQRRARLMQLICGGAGCLDSLRGRIS
jgi:DNA repair exonuclease SbcCD ATPase subunit